MGLKQKIRQLPDFLFHNLKISGILFSSKSPGDGIGRRVSLRGICPYGRAGSNPVLGTRIKKSYAIAYDFFILVWTILQLFDI